jgi:hypothetical protein
MKLVPLGQLLKQNAIKIEQEEKARFVLSDTQ